MPAGPIPLASRGVLVAETVAAAEAPRQRQRAAHHGVEVGVGEQRAGQRCALLGRHGWNTAQRIAAIE